MVALDATKAPTILADGRTVRYYLTGTFVAGAVNVTFLGGVVERHGRQRGRRAGRRASSSSTASSRRHRPATDRVFFIDISGAMELRLADLFDEPILEIRGKVSIEIGDRTVATRTATSSSTRTAIRRSASASRSTRRDDQGDQARQHRLGRRLVRAREGRRAVGHRVLGRRRLPDELRVPRAVRDLRCSGSALLQINATDEHQQRDALARGHPGRRRLRAPDRRPTRRALAALPSDTFNPVALPAGVGRALLGPAASPADIDADGLMLGDADFSVQLAHRPGAEARAARRRSRSQNATIEGIVPGKKWKIKNGDGRQFFVEKATRLDGNRGPARPRRGAHLRPRAALVRRPGHRRPHDQAHRERRRDRPHGRRLLDQDPRPSRFEFFVTAGGSITPLGLSGRVTGLFIASASIADGAIPGIAGLLRLELTAGIGPDEPGDDRRRRRPRIAGIFEFQGRDPGDAEHDPARAAVPRARGVPRRPAASGFPTELVIFKSAPAINGMEEEDPTGPAERYTAALIEGSITLFGVVTLSGFMSFTTAGNAPPRRCGSPAP